MKAGSNAQMRNKRIIEGVLTGTLGKALGLLAPFLVMPGMLQYLGPVNFGIWMTAVSITSMALFMDFGIGNGLLTKLSQAHGKTHIAEMRRLITTGYASLSGIAIVACTGLVTSVLLFKYNDVFGTKIDTEGQEIILATSLSFLIGIPISVIQRVLMACQKNIEANLWPTVGSLLAIPICYASIHLQLPKGIVVAIYSITPLLTLLVATAIFFSNRRELRPNIADFSYTEAKKLVSLGSRFFALSIITSFSLNSDNLILAINLGPETVTDYAVPAKIGALLGLAITTMFLPLWAANGEAIARKDFKWMEQAAKRMAAIGGMTIGTTGILLTYYSSSITQVWMGREFSGSTEVVAGFTLLYVFMAIASPFQMILNSHGATKIQIQSWIAFAISSITLKYAYTITTQDADATPFISAICFSLIVLPLSIRWAKRIYSNDSNPN